MTYKYTVEFESEHDLLEHDGYDPIDIVESSLERGTICADKNGVASWWYKCPSYAIEWKIIRQQVVKKKEVKKK